MTNRKINSEPSFQDTNTTGRDTNIPLFYRPVVVALVYAILGAVWIALTDILVDWLFEDSQNYVIAQFVKGIIFILTTSLIIYWLAKRAKLSSEHKMTSDRLDSTKRHFDAVLASIGEAVLVVDPYGRYITNCNKAAEQLFGYSKEEMLGRDTEFLHVDRKHFERFSELGDDDLEKKGVFQTEYQMKRKDGSIIDTYNTVSTVHDDLGWQAGVVSIIRDITESKKAREVIQQNLREKEVMLKEIHHRVKNNLSIISGLLYLQSEQVENKQQALDAFEKSRYRIQSMARVHDKLYRTENLVQIDMKEYIEEMAGNLMQTLQINSDIAIEYNLDDIYLDINRAVPCGLILNELVTNAFKHAFKDQDSGRIEIELKESGDHTYQLTVSDNGAGLPEQVSLEEVNTLGFQIINTLVQQINGRLEIDNNEGTHFNIFFPAE